MTIEKNSPCKVNLLLNVLGKRDDGFHELETIMQPVAIFDRLSFAREGSRIELTCNNPELPADSRNLAHRAASLFIEKAQIREGVRIHLEKHIPLAAGVGGGSGNAATTLLGLNELFGCPLSSLQLEDLAAALGSDVPFFLQEGPALATGRGERIERLAPFPALRGAAMLLMHPGFGVATAWAYQNLGRFPEASRGQSGRARKLISKLQSGTLLEAGQELYNSLEAPALEKHPILALYQEFLRSNGAAAALMSGSGSTTFAVTAGQQAAETLCEKFKVKFGRNCWTAVVPV